MKLQPPLHPRCAFRNLSKRGQYAACKGCSYAFVHQGLSLYAVGPPTPARLCRPVVPHRGGILPQGGILWVQGRTSHFIVKVPLHFMCCTSFLSWHWLFTLVTSLYICRFLVGYHTFFWQILVQIFDNKQFLSTFINQVLVVNKDHCSNCS